MTHGTLITRGPRTLRTLSPRHPHQEGSNKRRPQTLRTLVSTSKGSTPCKTTRRVQEATTRVHEETTRVHEETTRVLEETTRVHEETTRVHEETTRVLEETTRVHEETTRVLEKTMRVHEETTRVHEETTRVLEETTRVYEETTRVPEETTRVPEATTRVPEATTSVHQATTRVHEETRRVHEATTGVHEATSRVLEMTTRGPKTTQWTQNRQQRDDQQDDNFRPASLDLLLFYCNKLSWVGLGHLARGVKLPPARGLGSRAIHLTRTHRPRIANNKTTNRTKTINFVRGRLIILSPTFIQVVPCPLIPRLTSGE